MWHCIGAMGFKIGSQLNQLHNKTRATFSTGELCLFGFTTEQEPQKWHYFCFTVADLEAGALMSTFFSLLIKLR
jgi:hypothetical protein